MPDQTSGEGNISESEHNQGQISGPVASPPATGEQVPASGKRLAFRDLRRQLTDEDLKNPGTIKLIIDDLERSESQLSEAIGYIDRYHEADKRAAVLAEQLKTEKAIDIFFGVGIGVGSAIISLSTYFWGISVLGGLICVLLGAALVIGAIKGREIKR